MPEANTNTLHVKIHLQPPPWERGTILNFILEMRTQHYCYYNRDYCYHCCCEYDTTSAAINTSIKNASTTSTIATAIAIATVNY